LPLQTAPSGFRKLLNWIRKEYSNVPVFVTENGFPDAGQMQDTARIKYIVVSSGSVQLVAIIISKGKAVPVLN
jgi:beta-glucosidase/6-phospho-beta-glucosidase/beta-galactosidase